METRKYTFIGINFVANFNSTVSYHRTQTKVKLCNAKIHVFVIYVCKQQKCLCRFAHYSGMVCIRLRCILE